MKTIIAIIVIGLLIAYAIYSGVNGAVYTSGIALIGGLGGYAIHKKVKLE